jgi:hypothetical protein
MTTTVSTSPPRHSTKSMVIVEWHAWDGFLVSATWPDARRVSVDPGQSLPDLSDEIASGDVVLFQINLTKWAHFIPALPEATSCLRARGLLVVNAAATDTSKRALGRARARLGLLDASAGAHGDPGEFLIVKTNWNCGGESEAALANTERGQLLGLDSENCPLHGPQSYVVKERRDIPREWWDSETLCIERFVSNTSGSFRRVYLAGNRVVVSESASHAVIKKMGSGLNRESWFWECGSGGERVPLSIERLIRDARLLALSFKLGYGAIDAVMDDARNSYIVDLNPTPFWGEDEPEITGFLAAGFDGFPTTWGGQS